jgi:hypothetical protein
MTVSVMSVLPAFVPPFLASETLDLRGNVEGNRGSALPSEGRGQRFESSWVRQFSATFERGSRNALVLPFESRGYVHDSFPTPDTRRMVETGTGSMRSTGSGLPKAVQNMAPKP